MRRHALLDKLLWLWGHQRPNVTNYKAFSHEQQAIKPSAGYLVVAQHGAALKLSVPSAAHQLELEHDPGKKKATRGRCVIFFFALRLDWTRGKQTPKTNMLTCSLVFLSATNSCCNLSALSSATSACSCKNLIFRFTASSDVAPAIVHSYLFVCIFLIYMSEIKKNKDFTVSCSRISEKFGKQRDDVLDCAESCVKTVRELSWGALRYLSRKCRWFQNTPENKMSRRSCAEFLFAAFLK